MIRQEAQEALDVLGIREEAINAELRNNPGLSFDAASKAVDSKKELKLFEEGAYAAYMAHVRRYAHLYLRMVDEKDTISAVNDAVITLFSKEVSEVQRKTYAIDLCEQRLKETYGKEASNAIKSTDKDRYVNEVKSTFSDMYKHVLSPNNMPYEFWVERRIELESKYEQAAALAERFKERAHCLVAIAANLRAAGDTDAFQVHPYAVDVIERIKRAVVKNPEIDARVLSEIAESQLKAKGESHG